jgi:polysaccharide pyruvyl transferase CsaB
MFRKSIFIVGYYGFGNTGDEAILSTTIAQLRSIDSDLNIIVSSGAPAATTQDHNVKAVLWSSIGEIQRAIQTCDIVLIGGGGLFHDYWGVDPNSILTNSHWGISYYTGVALLASVHHKPIIILSVGIGPLISAHGIKLTKAACEIANLITVRDSESKTALIDIGVDESKIIVTADPAFLFETKSSFQIPTTTDSDSSPSKPVVGVAVRNWALGVHPDFLEHELASALDLFIQQTDGSVVFIPFQDLRGEHEDDRAVSLRIRSQMRLSNKTQILREGLSPDDIYQSIQQCDLIVGMRLHSVIFALLNHIPAVVLSYDPKIEHLAAEFGLGSWLLDVRAMQASELARRMRDALLHRADFDKPLSARIQRSILAARQTYSLIAPLVRQPPQSAELGPDAIELLSGGVQSQIRHIEQLDSRNRALITENASHSEALAQCKHQLEVQLLAQGRQIDQGRPGMASLPKSTEGENRQVKEAESHRMKELARENASLSMTVQSLSARLKKDTAALRQAQTDSAALASALQQLREAGTVILQGLERFQDAHEKQAAAYRSQRAWQVMLLFRKAYTLLVREPVGRWLPWLLKIPFSGFGSLAEYDLRFPRPGDYVPDHAAALLAAPAPAAAMPASGAAALTLHEPQQKYDIIILAIIDFDFRFQRPQQIAAEMARRGHRVFWVSPTRFLPLGSAASHAVTPLRPNLWEVHLRGTQPDIYMGTLEESHLQPLTASLDQFLREWTVSENVVMAQLPFWRRLALSLKRQWGSKVVYDCMDDWETFPSIGAFNISEEHLFAREADVLVVTAAELARKFEAQSLKPILVRNGADYDFFAAAQPSQLLSDVPHPIVGYFGAIADWIDLDLIYEVAKRRPDYSFVMIGQVFGRDISKLEALPNMFFLGNKQYQDIPHYLHHFDVCTIPFLINQVTKATDPVKLYEYFSLGKPVVATAMAELQQCADLLYIANDAEEFATSLDAAIGETDATLHQRRIAFSQENTWGQRVKAIDTAVTGAFDLVSIILVTHNSSRYIRPCLDSVLHHTSYPNYEVIVVDNASTDDSVAIVKEYAQSNPHIQLITSETNLGFAGGNNLAINHAHGQYFILLNIDTIVTPGWVGRLLYHIQTDSSIGLICPVTNFAGNEAKINIEYKNYQEMIRFSQTVAHLNHGLTTDIAVAPLFCAVISKSFWNTIGELDTRYEIGMFEDDDYSIRVWNAHSRVVVAEDCFVHHFGQGSFSKLSNESYNRIFSQNKARYEDKWSRPWVAHKPRTGVRPAHEETKFEPETFEIS